MPIAKKLSKTEIESIYSAANSAIWHSHFRAGKTAKKFAREEDYVATLVTDGIPVLGDRWRDILESKGIALRVSGVFCHGHPQVRFGPTKSRVELADLLVVHQHSTKSRNTTRAMLIQAKMSTDATHRLPSNDPQLALYAGWPPFEFVTGGLKPGVRNLKEIGKGSRYALVLQGHEYPEQITWADQCPWAASSARQDLAAEHSLAKLLGNMLLGKDGRPVRLRSYKDDWSRTIKELLEITGKKTYRRANIGRGETTRLAGSTALGILFLSQSQSFFSRSLRQGKFSASDVFFRAIDQDKFVVPPDGHENGEGPGGGISSLIIETIEVDQ